MFQGVTCRHRWIQVGGCLPVQVWRGKKDKATQVFRHLRKRLTFIRYINFQIGRTDNVPVSFKPEFYVFSN